MPKRYYRLANGETYHVFNRSIDNREILSKNSEIEKFLALIDYYRFPQSLSYSKYRVLAKNLKEAYLTQYRQKSPLVSVLSYAIMPDHYHFLLKQLSDEGIKTFTSKIQNAFAKHTNTKFKRRGSLFLNPFKAKHIDTDEILVHVSRYIHLNPVTGYIFNFSELRKSSLTSFPYYLKKLDRSPESLVDNSLLLTRFRGSKGYADFVANQVDYQRKLAKIKRLLFD